MITDQDAQLILHELYQNKLFYLQSRGIPVELAVDILAKAEFQATFANIAHYLEQRWHLASKE